MKKRILHIPLLYPFFYHEVSKEDVVGVGHMNGLGDVHAESPERFSNSIKPSFPESSS